MITGPVADSREATVTLHLRGLDGRELQTDAVVDTGFTDFLMLPRVLISQLQLAFWDFAECEQADGVAIETETYQVAVTWDGQDREVLALAGGCALVGMGLLRGFRLQMDVIPDGRVKIRRLPP